MAVIIDIFRLIAISQLALLTFLFLRKNNKTVQDWANVFLGLCLMSYLIAYWQPIFDNRLLFLILLPFSVALPLSFWLFSKALFDDSFEWNASYLGWGMVIIGIHTLLFLMNGYAWDNLENDWKTLIKLPPYLMSISFVLMGLFEAIKNYDTDLILPRLRFRYPFVIASSLIMLLTLASLMTLQHDNLPTNLELVQKIGIAVSIFYFAIHQLNLKQDTFQDVEVVVPNLSSIDDDMLSKLNVQMEEHQLYLTEGLTIRYLAERMEVKEYKLRKFINQHLGFRNFNEFLNTYRIKYACNILSNPSQKELTIMEIAYDAGYTSLTPFNKAFKNITKNTPSAYRKEKLNAGKKTD